MNAGLTRDLWAAIEPDIEAPQLQRIVDDGNTTIPLVRPEDGPDRARLPGARLPAAPAAGAVPLLASPLVMWIWIGGMIVLGGGLIAIWPAPSAVRRRVACACSRRARGRARA